MKTKTRGDKFTQMGMAALLPGMQYMLERMQSELDDLRLQLTLAQGGSLLDLAEKHPRAYSRKGGLKKKQTLHPRDPKHPGHAKWIAAMRRTQKRVWQNMSAEERQARHDRMAAGKTKRKNARKTLKTLKAQEVAA